MTVTMACRSAAPPPPEPSNVVRAPAPDPERAPDPAPSPTPTPQRASFIGGNLDGWRINLGRLHNPGIGGAGQGEHDGYLHTEPPGEGKTSYFLGSDTFLGDWRGHRALSLWLRSQGGTAYHAGYGMGADVEIWSGNARATRMLPQRPPSTWTRYDLPLEEQHWQVHGASFSEILSQVTELRIRAEYGVGRDTTGLDEVLLY